MTNRNTISPQDFKALKQRFNGSMTIGEAKVVLDAARDDPSPPPILRLNLASAIVDLQTGRSVQSTMARLRRATGLDPDKKSKS